MGKVLVTDTHLTDIANAIRGKNETTNTYKPSEMAGAIENIETGITPTGSLDITENGIYDVTEYASANVNVASSGGESSGGKYAPRIIRFQNYTGTELNEETANLDTSNITKMSSMFQNCSNLIKLDLKSFIGENVTATASMFASCTALTEIDLRNFTPTKITSIASMFSNCKSLKKIDLRSWELNTKITSTLNAFYVVPEDCEIIVKDETAKEFILSLKSTFTNIKTVAEYEAQ